MGVPAGSLDRKVTIRRRAVTGATLGDFQTYRQAWGNFRQLGETDVTVSGFGVTVKSGVLMVRDNAETRTISSADRIQIEGEDYEVRAASLPDFRTGMIRLDVASALGRSGYANAINRRGETITVRRIVPNGSPINAQARAWITGYTPEELVGGMNQGDRKVLVLARDLESATWPLPIRRNDKVLIRGALMNVEEVDDSTHRSAGVLNAYELRVTG